jgi:Domain of unknown function (DUF4160)
VAVVYREHCLRFVIYVDDHEPAHVHVRGDGEAKIELGNAEMAPTLVFSKGLSNADLRRAMRVVRARSEEFLQDWKKVHG